MGHILSRVQFVFVFAQPSGEGEGVSNGALKS
jgi:hypothetical protein